MNILSPEISKTSILEVPQQFLSGENTSRDLEHQLGRACTVHAFSAARELLDNQDQTPISGLVSFVAEFGAGKSSELYADGVGWRLVELADLLRLKGHPVVSQNLSREQTEHDIKAAAVSGRVRTNFEKSRLALYSESGGPQRNKWLQAIQGTLVTGGVVATSIEIPLLSGQGHGLHSVVVTEYDPEAQTVTYFDSDHYNTLRYGDKAPVIERTHSTQLMYRRSVADHLATMTGEVVHIFPARG